MDILAENVKNLAIRLGKHGPLDKKLEKKMKMEMLNKHQTELNDWMSEVRLSISEESK